MKRLHKPIRRGRWRLLLAACCLCAGVALFFSIQLHISQRADRYITSAAEAPRADAILVLGCYVYPDGTPSLMLQDRLDQGLELYRAGRSGRIIVSGDHGTKEYDEVNAMRNYLVERGVPAEAIFMDHAGFDTYDSMYRAKAIFCADSLLVCTQNYHMGRALYIARSLGLEASGVPTEDRQAFGMPRQYAREGLARIKAFLDTEILCRPPKYLGEPIPVSGSGLLTEG